MVVALIAYLAISFRVAETVTQVERVPLDPPASSIAATHEDVTFTSRDDLVLKGWWFEVSGADRAVVVVHGRGRNPPGIVLMARIFLGLDISQVTPSKVVAAHPIARSSSSSARTTRPCPCITGWI